MTSERSHSICLEGDLSIRDSATISADLSRVIHQQESATVETDGVKSIDIGVLQLLVAAQKSARNLGKRLKIHVPAGGALDVALKRSGVFAAIDLAVVWEGAFWTGLSDENRSSGA